MNMTRIRTTRILIWPITVALVIGFRMIQSQDKHIEKKEYPLWDEKESVADYAKGAGLEREMTLDLGDGVKYELVLIPAGKFIMGSPVDEKDRHSNEGPQHEVIIKEPFFMGKYEVTQAQYIMIMKADPSQSKGVENPVECVSWINAEEFCKKLSQMTGRTFRLPSESEWEYACRAGSKTPFHPPIDRAKVQPLTDEQRRRVAVLIPRLASGDFEVRDNATRDLIALGKGILSLLDSVKTDDLELQTRLAAIKSACKKTDLQRVAWIEEASNKILHRVGEKEPNAFGLYDMHGNVEEWVEDDFHKDYIGAPTNGQPWIDKPRSPCRVLRGGAYSSETRDIRAASRNYETTEAPYIYVGFRIISLARVAD
jgi:formylglycine-generating enzyme required for sulfatase activity